MSKNILYGVVGFVLASLLFLYLNQQKESISESSQVEEINKQKKIDTFSDLKAQQNEADKKKITTSKVINNSESYFDNNAFIAKTLESNSLRPKENLANNELISSELPSNVSFDENGYILTRDKGDALSVSVTNVHELSVRVYRVDERALALNIRPDKFSTKEVSDSSLEYWINNDLVEVWKGSFLTGVTKDVSTNVAIPLNDVFSSHKNGVFLVAVQDKKVDPFANIDSNSINQDSKQIAIQWVNFTDIAVTSFWGVDGIHVSLHSYNSGKPYSAGSISLIAANNEILVSRAVNKNGWIHFSKEITSGIGANSPKTIMVNSPDNDFAYHYLTKTALDLSKFEISGKKSLSNQNIYMHSDRGIYRPGETIRLSGIMRNQLSQSIPHEPIKISILSPSGVEYKTINLQGDEFGGYETEFELPLNVQRGAWRIRAQSLTFIKDAYELSVSIEDFVPKLVNVTIEDDQDFLNTNIFKKKISAEFLYGAPASNLSIEGQLSFERIRKPFEDYSDFYFGEEFNSDSNLKISLQDQKLDKKGETVFSYDLKEVEDKLSSDKHVFSANLITSVQEPGGRLTSASKSWIIDNASSYLGVSPEFKDSQVPYNSHAKFKVINFKPNVGLSNTDIKWKLEAVNHNYQWSQVNGRWRYIREEVTDVVEVGLLSINNKSENFIETKKLDWGKYRLSVTGINPGIKAVSANYDFYSGYSWNTNDGVESPSRVNLFTNKKEYVVDEKVAVQFNSLFAGHAKIILLNDSVKDVYEISVNEGSNQISLPYKKSYGLGVYVMAYIVRSSSLNDSSRLPHRTIGSGWIAQNIKPIEVSMTLPENVRPRQQIEIPVFVKDPSSSSVRLRVDAVDEGILMLTNYQSPNLFEYFMGKKRLEVDIRDEYNRLLLTEGQITSIRTGSDSVPANISGNALSTVPSKSVSLFDSEITLDKYGNGKIKFDLPDFQGKLRLMANAWSKEHVGSATETLTVRDEVVSTVVMPNYLAPDDKSQITVRYYNSSDKVQTIKSSFDSQNKDVVSLAHNIASFRLNPKGVLTKTYSMSAISQGIAKLKLELTYGNVEIERYFDLQVRYQGYPEVIESSQKVTLSEFKLLKVPDNKVVDRYHATFSLLPKADIAAFKTDIKAYPYGCSEQLTNKGLPLLNELNLLKQGLDDVTIENYAKRIQHSLDAIISRVRSNGRIGLWGLHSGEINDSLYPYIGGFLVEAKMSGFDIPDDILSRVVSRIETHIFRKISDSTLRTYIASVLVKYDPSYIRLMHGETANDLLSLARKTYAYSKSGLIGDAKKYFKELKENYTSNLNEYSPMSGNYFDSKYSSFFQLLEYFTDFGQHEFVRQELSDFLEKNEIENLSLREKSLLAKVITKLNNTTKMKVAVDGENLPVTFGSSTLVRKGEDLQRDYRVTLSQPLWVNEALYIINTEKMSSSANSSIIEKVFRNGGQIEKALDLSKDTLKVGDILTHKITVNIPKGIRQYVLDIPLAAGIEVQEILTQKQTSEWSDSELDIVQVEFDRVITSFFGDSYRDSTIVLEFKTRVITPGEYIRPRILLEDMYRPENKQFSAQVRVVIDE